MATKNQFLTYSVAASATYGPAYRSDPGEGFAELLADALRSDATSAGEWLADDRVSLARRQLTDIFRGLISHDAEILRYADRQLSLESGRLAGSSAVPRGSTGAGSHPLLAGTFDARRSSHNRRE